MARKTTDAAERREIDREDDFEAITVREVGGAVVAGTVGTSWVTLALYLLDVVYAGELNVFGQLAAMAGGGGNELLGFVLFFVAGSLAWPLIYVTLGAYLPGSTRVRQGILFGLLLWVGFAIAFSGPQIGIHPLVLVVVSLLAHVVYGAILGGFSARLTGRYAPRDVPV